MFSYIENKRENIENIENIPYQIGPWQYPKKQTRKKVWIVLRPPLIPNILSSQSWHGWFNSN